MKCFLASITFPRARAENIQTLLRAEVLRDIARRAGRGRGSGAAAQHLAPPPLGGICFADLDFSGVAAVRVERDGHCCFRRDGVVDVGWPGFWRGYAAAGYSGRRGGGGPSRRMDDYEERRPRKVSPKFFINGQLKGSKSVEATSFWLKNTATTSTSSTSQPR